MMEAPLSLQEVGNSVADFGFLVVAAALYLILSSSLFYFFVKWFMQIIDGIIVKQQKVLDEILKLQRLQSGVLEEIGRKIKMRA